MQQMITDREDRHGKQAGVVCWSCAPCACFSRLAPLASRVPDGVCVYRGVPMMTTKGAVTATIANAWVK